ncbi:hypothetical protein [Lacimonas salitolerans]|uniref:Uncharacterized protein n=1 Tax=Lacimonas salitolerans TaxID=1323750 RepID=A0ABW4ED73_9RHOB
MSVIFNNDLPDALSNPVTYTVQVGDRFFVFNDGTRVPRGEESSFAVYDDSGSLRDLCGLRRTGLFRVAPDVVVTT